MPELINIPPLTLEQFFAIPDGTYVYNYGNDQCVALANQYYQGTLNLELPQGISAARQWWELFDQKPQLYNNCIKVESARKGDIFVSLGGSYDAVYGHIGVVERDWDGSTFGTIENGYWSNGKSYVKRFNRSLANVLGFIRPKSFIANVLEQSMYVVKSTDGGMWLIREYGAQRINDAGDFETLKKILASNPKDPDLFVSNMIDSVSKYLTPPTVKVDMSGVQINVDALAQAIADKIDCGGQPDVTTKAEILEAIEANYPGDK